MDTSALFDRLAYEGVLVTLIGGTLTAAPRELLTDELRELIRTHKPALIEFLRARSAEPIEASGGFEAALQIGALVICRRCAHFAARPARLPDGYCARHNVETWARVSFTCETFSEGQP